MEYNACLSRGYDPLLIEQLPMDLNFRIQVQKKTFGNCILGMGKIPKANQKYYLYVWENKKHICENCMKPLYSYSASFISHILTKAAFPELAHDPRNSNILCRICHNKWEFGTENEKAKMLIYPTNAITKKKLLDEYKNR